MISDIKFRKSSVGGKILYVVFEIMLIGYAVAVIFPILNMFFSSFKSTREIFKDPFSLPTVWRVGNYVTVWQKGGFGKYFMNSIVITVVAMVFVLFFGTMAANAISRYDYKLRTFFTLLFISGLVLPLKVAIIPLFLLMKGLNLIDSRLGLVCIFTAMGLPSTIFILSGTMKGIPKELEYAARIDGCNEFGIYKNVVLPLSKPAISLVTIYNMVPIWNDFFFPMVMISSDNKRTLPLGVSTFFGEYQIAWDLVFTALSISVLPMIALYVGMANFFIKGMTVGAIKG